MIVECVTNSQLSHVRYPSLRLKTIKQTRILIKYCRWVLLELAIEIAKASASDNTGYLDCHLAIGRARKNT